MASGKKEPKEVKGTINYCIKLEGEGEIAFKLDNCTSENVNEFYFIAISMVIKELSGMLDSPLAGAMPGDMKEQVETALEILIDFIRVKARKLEEENGFKEKGSKAEELLKALSNLFKGKGMDGISFGAVEITADGVKKVDIDGPEGFEGLFKKIREQSEGKDSDMKDDDEKKEKGDDEISI